MICSGSEISAVTKPKDYIASNLKKIDSLLEQKKSSGSDFSLDVMFEEYVVDAKELLKILSEEEAKQQTDEKKQEIVMQIAQNMAILQELLKIMKSGQTEPLKVYCRDQRGNALWGSLCGERPSKRIPMPDEFEKKNQKNLYLRRINHKDDTLEENLQSSSNLGA